MLNDHHNHPTIINAIHMWNLLRFLKNLEAKLMHILYARAQLRKLRARAREGDEKRSMLRARAIFHPYYNAAALYRCDGGPRPSVVWRICYALTKMIRLICRVDRHPSSFKFRLSKVDRNGVEKVLRTGPQTDA